MEILNRKTMTRTEGLVVLFIPQLGEEGPPENVRDLIGEDFYLGGDFVNFPKTLQWASQHGVSGVWTNPLKFITSPEKDPFSSGERQAEEQGEAFWSGPGGDGSGEVWL